MFSIRSKKKPHDNRHSCQPNRRSPPVLAPRLPLTPNPSGWIAHHLYPRWSTRLSSVRRWSNMEPKGHRAGKSSSFEEVACHMMGLISRCRGTQSRVFALSNSGTGLETPATSTVISHSHTQTRGRTEILLAHFIHIMNTRLRQLYCMEMRNTAVDSDTTCQVFFFLFFEIIFNALVHEDISQLQWYIYCLRVRYGTGECWSAAAWPATDLWHVETMAVCVKSLALHPLDTVYG